MSVVFLDTSALLRRYFYGPEREAVVSVMDSHEVWCGSALAKTETLTALHRMSITTHQHEELWGTFRRDWDSFVEIPVDDRCLARALELGATFHIRTVDAIHLAAADRLPKPLTFASYDRNQLAAAVELGFTVLSAEA